jgi:hypothetical protein
MGSHRHPGVVRNDWTLCLKKKDEFYRHRLSAATGRIDGSTDATCAAFAITVLRGCYRFQLRQVAF